MKKLSDIGMIGLGVMGENLALNMANKGFYVSVYNRTVRGVEEGVVERFVQGKGKDKNIRGFNELKRFVQNIERPRKIMMMIKAGKPVDMQIKELLPFLEAGDVVIDGGNSHFEDTQRRMAFLEEKGIYFIGTGISGGENGALKGASIMPGGSKKAWPLVKDIFRKIAAKCEDGTPCCDWIGEGGAGHFVKMVHNGIEYGDMQIIAEAYWVMKKLLGLDYPEMHQIFKAWNQGELKSYLIQITADIMTKKDNDGQPLLEKILDVAGQKGTGRWTVINALNMGSPLTLIADAVFARNLSAKKEERVRAGQKLPFQENPFIDDKNTFVNDLEKALYAAKLISYAQGFDLIKTADEEFNWNLKYGKIAHLWEGGCIIRSIFLKKIESAFEQQPVLSNLLLDDFFASQIKEVEEPWKRVVATTVLHGIPIPSIASALSYFYEFRSADLPANLIQAQRDYFGAHTYERKDAQRNQYFHTRWMENKQVGTPISQQVKH